MLIAVAQVLAIGFNGDPQCGQWQSVNSLIPFLLDGTDIVPYG